MTDRRTFLGSTMAGAISGLLPFSAHTSTTDSIALKAAPTRVRLVPRPYNLTDVWGYNHAVPGPEIRIPQGERVRILFENHLDEETTVHWHGVRLPNGMDGVPHLTQPPVAPGQSFVYDFTAVDAGTFWYHPHQRSFEQVGRGLYGPLIIEEQEPIRTDRDITWMLDDWRLVESAGIKNDFGNRHDMSHNGRIGNTVTINGKLIEEFAVHRGERIRLRLINAANARIFALEFDGHNPLIIAMDGQPVAPHSPANGRVVLGPAMRIDVVLDMTGDPGSRHLVTDSYYQGREYQLVDLVYSGRVVREETPDWPTALPSNGLAEPDMERAVRHEIVFTGGIMGSMTMDRMGFEPGNGMDQGMGSMMDRMRSGKIWQINGVAAEGHVMEPMLTLQRGSSHIFEMINATAWDHPMHFHGHSFRVLSRNGINTMYREWQDTVLLSPEERVEIALVADNPGDWMFHCHILEHQAAGMMGVIRVTGTHSYG